MRFASLLALLFVTVSSAWSQTINHISGTIIDSESGQFLDGATVLLLDMNEISPVRFTYTNAKGEFSISDVAINPHRST